MGKRRRRRVKREETAGIPKWVHLIILLLIVGLVAFMAFRLWKWNKGTDSVYDPTEDTSEFDIEVLDQVFILSPDKLEGHEDDGVDTILFLGNDAITYDTTETGLVSQIQQLTGATVYNTGFPGSYVSMKNATVQSDYTDDLYSFYNVTQSIVNEDYSALIEDSQTRSDYQYYTSATTLESLDFNTVDTLVIMYDANDYLGLRTGMNPDNDVDPQTYMGSFKAGIQAIQEKYPFIRIVLMSFTFCYGYDSDGNLVNGGKYDYGNGSLPTYFQHAMDVAGDTGVSFIDNYYGTVTQSNTSEYLLDNIHVNQECNAYIANHFVEQIYPDALSSGDSSTEE